jgi:conjugal transfer pilus assembly protein TraB
MTYPEYSSSSGQGTNMSDFSAKASAFWEKLSPSQKKLATISSVIVALIGMLILSYSMGGSKSIPVKKEAPKKNTVPLEPNLLEKSLYLEKEQELRQRDEQMKALKAEIDEIKKEKSGDRAKGIYPPIPISSLTDSYSRFPAAPLPVPNSPAARTALANRQVEPELVGDIEVFVNPQAKVPVETDKSGKKKEAEKIYLPPSFMPVVLLTGVRAKTSGNGTGDPQPILLRVTDLAVLPNRIKKDMRECFIVANAVGDLSMERADVRLVSLHCLAKDGRVAIDQKVKGTVLDADGVTNLDGKVVARFGTTLAAAAYAGAFAGIGDGLKAASNQTLITATGTITQIKPGDLLMGAAGSGAAGAFHNIADFMMTIAKQTMPVVEVGNMKPVTVFITEGIDIEVKNYCSRLDTLGGATCKNDL